MRIEAPKPARWYLSSDAFGTLAGASPLRASGRNIEIWLPHEAHTGERSRAWMKLQNEVQMAWFEHPVNEAREARGLPAVNSIWFHAQGAAQPVKSPFARVLSDAAATRGLALTAGVETARRRLRLRRCSAATARMAQRASGAHGGNAGRSNHAGRTRSVLRALHRAGLGALERRLRRARRPTGSPPRSPPCSRANSANSASRCAATPAR